MWWGFFHHTPFTTRSTSYCSNTRWRHFSAASNRPLNTHIKSAHAAGPSVIQRWDDIVPEVITGIEYNSACYIVSQDYCLSLYNFRQHVSHSKKKTVYLPGCLKKIMKRFSSLFSYLFQAHMDIQPHLCRAPVRSNRCIRKLGDKRGMLLRLEGGGGRVSLLGEMCPLLPWWHIDSVDYVCSVVWIPGVDP